MRFRPNGDCLMKNPTGCNPCQRWNHNWMNTAKSYWEDLIPNRRVDLNAVKGAPFLGGVLAAEEQTKRRLRKSGADLAKKGEPKKRNQPEPLRSGRRKPGSGS